VLCGFFMQCLVIAQNAIAKVIHNFEEEAAHFTGDELAYTPHWFDFWGGAALFTYLVAYQSYFFYVALIRNTAGFTLTGARGGLMAFIDRFRNERPNKGHHKWHRVTSKSVLHSGNHRLHRGARDSIAMDSSTDFSDTMPVQLSSPPQLATGPSQMAAGVGGAPTPVRLDPLPASAVTQPWTIREWLPTWGSPLGRQGFEPLSEPEPAPANKYEA